MSRKVKANGKIFTFNDNVTDEQISKAVDEYFKGDIKKKEPSQELPSQKVQTTQAQPIQPKSSGTGSFMGGAEGAYQESKILRLSKKVVEDSKKIELENERIKKEETAKKLGNLNIDFSGGFADIEGIRNQIKTKLKDASISEINAFNDIISENIKKGNVSYTGYRQSSVGKSNELIDNVKNGIELSQEDEAYLRKTSPKAYDELIKSTSDGVIPTSVNSIAKQYKQFNQKRFQASANEDIKGSLNVLSSIGIDVNKMGTYKITEELSKVESKYNTEIEKLNQKYPLKDYTYEINDGRGVSKQTVKKRDDAYAQEKAALDNKYGGLKQTMGKVNAFKFALQNADADAEAVGEEALRVSDPIRYNNYIKGGKKSIDVKEDVHKLGYTILQSTGNDKLVTKGVAAEQEHENKYPNEVINETKKRIAIEYAKSIGGEKIAFNKGKLSIQDADKFVDQLPQKYKDVYLKKIRPYAVNENGVVSKMTNTSDPNFRYLFTNKEINPKDAVMDIPDMGGIVNSFFGKGLIPIEGAFNFVLDRLDNNEGITNRALQKPKLYQQELTNRDELSNRINELSKKDKLSIQEAIELDENKKELNLSTPFKKIVDKSFGLLGQVAGQIILAEVGTPVIAAPLKGLQVGTKIVGLTNTTERIANYASEFKNIKTISGSTVSYISSYSDAEKEAINLGLDGWKRTLYSNTVAGLNAATEHIFPDTKIGDAFMQEVSPLIANMVSNLTTRNVSQSVLSNSIKDFITKTLPKFAGKMVVSNQKESGEELATQIGTTVAKRILAPDQFNTQDELNAMKQVWYETTISGGLTSFGGALAETQSSSISKKAMYQLGSNTDEINKFVDVVNTQVSNGKMSQEDANDKIKAVNTIQQIVQKSIPLIDSKRKLTEGEKVKLSNILLAERKLQDEIKDPNFSDVKLLNEKELSKVQELKNKILNNEVFIDDNLDVYSEEEYNAKRDAEKLAEEQAKTQTNDTKTETKPETPITEVTTTTGQTAENVGETTTGQAPIIPTAQEQFVTNNTEVKNEPSVSLEEESKVIEAKIAELEAKRKEEYESAIESFKNKTGKEISQTTKDNLNKKISSTYNPQIEELQSQLKEKQDAIKESNKQQQEGGTESNISQREGAIQGQQESNQVRGGQQGNATQSTTNISNSNQQGEGQKEVKALEQKSVPTTKAEIEAKVKETESKIKRKDLFTGVGDFSKQLGNSDKAAVPVSHNENNGIEIVEYAHPDTGSVDVIVTGKTNNDFVGFYRIYENGKPTNKWSSKFENQSRNKEDFKTMISGVQELLPEGHQYTEKTSISTDGLRVWEQQLSKGYQTQTDENGKIITNRVAINGDAISNVLGIETNKGSFKNIKATKEEFENIKKVLTPYMEKLGLGSENIYFESGGPVPGSKGSVKIDLPILKKSDNITPKQQPTTSSKSESKTTLKDVESRKKEIKSENDKLQNRRAELNSEILDIEMGEGKYSNIDKKESDARLKEINSELNSIRTKRGELLKELEVIESESIELFSHPNTNHGSTNTIKYDVKNDKLVEIENIVRGETNNISIEDAAKRKFETTLRGRSQKEIDKAYTDEVKAKYESEITDEISKYKLAEQPTTSKSESNPALKDVESTAKQKLDPDLANINPIIIAARNGDKQAQKKLEEYGLDWEQTTTYRFVGQSEVDVLLSDKKVESKRFSDAGIDVTTSPNVTSAANAEYRVTFKESFDVNNGLGKVKLKSKEEGDHNLERGRGYDINDVAKIERLDENGNVVEVVYKSEPILSKEQQKNVLNEKVQAEGAGAQAASDIPRQKNVFEEFSSVDNAVTLSGLSEKERQAEVDKRNKSLELSDAEKAESKVADLVHKHNGTGQYAEDKKLSSLQKQSVKSEIRKISNAQGFEVQDTGGFLRVYKKAKKALKGKSGMAERGLTKVKQLRKDGGRRSILPNNKPLDKRSEEVQKSTIEILNLEVDLDFRNLDDNSRMLPAQLNSAIEDILNGIPSIQATWVLDKIEQSVNSNQFEFGDKVMGFGMIPLDEYLSEARQLANENILANMSDAEIVKMYENQLNQDEQLNNIIKQEYEKQQDVQQSAERITASSIEANKEGAIQQRADEKNKGEEGDKASVNEIPNSNIGLEKGFKEYLQGQNMSKSTKAVMTFVQKMFPKIAANTKIVKDQKVWNKAFEDHNNDPKNADNQLNKDDFNGFYAVGDDGKITILLHPTKSNDETLIHELIHAFTQTILDNPLTVKEKAYVKSINKLFQDAKKSKKVEEFLDGYVFNDVAEFITYTMTNTEFQNLLNSNEATKTSWQKFKEAIGRVFGINSPSMVDKVISETTKIISISDYTNMQDRLSGKSAQETKIQKAENKTVSKINDVIKHLSTIFSGLKNANIKYGLNKGSVIEGLTNDQRTKMFKKAFGETTAKLIRSNMSFGFENPEKLIEFLKNKIPNKSDMPFIIKEMAADLEKEFLSDPENNKKEVTKENPKDLLSQVGYTFFEPLRDLEDAQPFRAYYEGAGSDGREGGSIICTYKDPSRPVRNFVMFIVKDGANETLRASQLTQDNLSQEWKDYLKEKGRLKEDGTFDLENLRAEREDPFSTSVLSIQVPKSGGNPKIISRYNHDLQSSNPDITFNGKLDTLVSGLEDSIYNYVNASKGVSNKAQLPQNVTEDNQGRLFVYGKEEGGIYYGDGFYIRGGIATMLDPNTERMVNGVIFKQDGSVLDVAGSDFMLKDIVNNKVKFLPNNSIRLETEYGNIEFPVKNGVAQQNTFIDKSLAIHYFESVQSGFKIDEDGKMIVESIFDDDVLFYHNDIIEVTGAIRLNSNVSLNADSLEKIGRDIVIRGNSIMSAKNLKSTTGEIGLSDKSTLITESLQTVKYGLEVGAGATLDAKSLKSVGSDIVIYGNAKLQDLEDVGDNLIISKGDFKLDNLKSVDGAIYVSGADAKLNAKSLQILSGSVKVRNGATLSLDSIENIRKEVSIGQNATFNADSLKSINYYIDTEEGAILNTKSLEFIGNDADFGSNVTLDSLQSIGGNLFLRPRATFNASSLKNINKAFVSGRAILNSLKTINKSLTVLGEFTANSLKNIGENLDVREGSNVTLDSLQSIGGNLEVAGKATLNSLQNVNGSVIIDDTESELKAGLLQNIGRSLGIGGYVELDSLKNINGAAQFEGEVNLPSLQSIGEGVKIFDGIATLNALKNVNGDILISKPATLNAKSLENVNGDINVVGKLLPSELPKQIKSNTDVKEITDSINNVYAEATEEYNVALNNGEDVDFNDFLPDEFKIKKQEVKLSSKTKPVSTTTKKEKTTLKNLINTLQKAIKANVFSDQEILKEKLKEYGMDYTKFMQGVNRLNVDLLDFSDVSKNISKNKIEGKILNEKESKSLQKEIESKYNNSDTPISKRFGQENEDIRQKAFSYDQPLAQKEVNGIDVRIAQGLVEGEPYSGKRRQTYLLYADGKIVGKFYSVNDAKSVVKLIESNLVNRPSISFMQTPNGVIYGAKFPDGTIYVNNENIDLSSPIHEFSHLFEEMYPELWSEGLRLYRDSSGFKKALKEVQDNPAYSNLTEQQQASEALNNLIGEKGVGYFAKGVLLSKFQNWMTKLFKNIGNRIGKQFGIKGLELKPDDKLDFFVNDVLGKLLGGKELKGETKISNITKFSQEYENSPQFEKWKGKNRLVSDRAVQDVKTGEPIVAKVYHGTTNEFYEFDASVKGNIEGHLGKVNYFTTSEDDANQNYLSQGADITARVENLKDRILSTLESEIDESLEEDEREDRIREVVAEFYPNFDNSSLDNDMSLEEIANRISQMELLGGDEKVLDLYVKLNNPIVLGNGSTWFDALEIDETYLEDATKEIADEYGISEEEAKDEYSWEINDRAIEMQGEGNKVVEALEKALSDNGYDSSLASQILGDNYYETEVDLDNIEKSLRKAELYENDNGEMASSQVIADLFKNLGFDGIILTDVSERFKNMGLNNSTSHIHVFDEFSNQIKLADGTNTTFNPDTNDIRYMSINGKQVQVKVLGVDVVNGFYSPIEKRLAETKIDKQSANKWLSVIGKGDEATWTGVKAWLEEKNPQEQVTKSEIQQWMKDNRIEINEIIRISENETYREIKSKEDAINAINDGFYITTFDGFTLNEEELDDEGLSYPLMAYNNKLSAIFEQYQLEGEKENYKEVLVTLPSKTVSEFSIKERQNPRGVGVIYDIVSNKTGLKVSTHRDAVEAMDNLKQYNKNIVEDRQMNFKSSHFDEPNILVHLRMNTRKDSEGNKVLFLEEVQSDWGQKGKKEGFYDKNLEKRRNELLDKAYEIERKENDNIVTKKVANTGKVTDYEVSYKDEKLKEELSKEKSIINKEIDEISKKIGVIPTAPFVMDTNAWTKLGLKIALKEAVKQGADKIAWTTGEQQNERYDLSKQVKQVEWNRYTERGAVKLVTITPITGNVIELPIDENGFVSKNAGTQFDGQRIDNVIGKEIGGKIVSENSGDLSGDGLKVGGKGMKGFYGSPTEGSLGIIGNVAKSLFKQEPKTVSIEISDSKVDLDTPPSISKSGDGRIGVSSPFEGEGKVFDAEQKQEALAYLREQKLKYDAEIAKRKTSTQNSIDITPELKAQVSEGLPMFMVRQNETQATKSEIENAINSLDTAVSEYESDDSIDNYLGLNDAFETLAYTSINDAQNMAKELSSKYPELKDDFNSILNEASKPKAESKKITNESDAIRTLISEDVDGRLYPTIVDSLGKFAQQVTAETTSNVQGREVNGDYVRLTLQNMKDIATQKMLQLQDVLGEDWVKKSIDFFEREPYSGNPAIIIGLSNIISTDLDNKIKEATDIKEIDSLTALQNRMDRVVNRNGRVASLALNYRRIFTSFAKGDSVTDAMSGNNLSEESKKQIEAVKKALAERPTDEELNSVGEVVTPSEPIAKSNKSSRKTTSDNTLKAQIKNNAINSLTQIDENGKKITRTWQDAVREAKEEAKNHKC